MDCKQQDVSGLFPTSIANLTYTACFKGKKATPVYRFVLKLILGLKSYQ